MPRFLSIITVVLLLLPCADPAIGSMRLAPAYPDAGGGASQYAAFPKPMETYSTGNAGVMEAIKVRAAADPFNVAASLIFLLAILHTFACGFFTRLAHRFEHLHQAALSKREAPDEEEPDGVAEVSFPGTLFHFLGEVEAVFGLWVIVLAAAATHYYSWLDFKLYVGEDCTFTEPLFVVVTMAIAASRPVLRFAEQVLALAAALGKGSPAAWWLSVLILAPVLGSFITEPAAMTIGALLLAKKFFPHQPSARLAYATLGLLFVNISVGGTLTSFAAPPVLMVAGKWGWDTPYMLLHFGWKALIGIGLASSGYYLLFRRELTRIAATATALAAGASKPPPWDEREHPIPGWVTGVHLGFLAWTVYATHFPVLFIGGFLFFLAFVMATRHHQNVVSLRSPMLVGFFLAGLVIHGGCQAWWIEPIIKSLHDQTLMLGATVLTAFNDNAAITYLAAQVADISATAKYAVVAGAVAGGGLTVIANAPNPAGQSILSRFFKHGISPLGLALGAIPPTLVVFLCLMLLPNRQCEEHLPPPDEERYHTPALDADTSAPPAAVPE
ncbi:MAG: putative Na+/H+ antiporter [Verrucomicrobia bacterium]|nr:putative Na+/H+ antiporter [Verrucomicrobiota bacterium]